MKRNPANTAKRSTMGRTFWRAAFCVGAVPLIGCIAVIVGQPLFGAAAPWLYWAAVALAVLCVIAAVQLRSYERHDAAAEGAWLARVGTRNSTSAWDDAGGIDD